MSTNVTYFISWKLNLMWKNWLWGIKFNHATDHHFCHTNWINRLITTDFFQKISIIHLFRSNLYIIICFSSKLNLFLFLGGVEKYIEHHGGDTFKKVENNWLLLKLLYVIVVLSIRFVQSKLFNVFSSRKNIILIDEKNTKTIGWISTQSDYDSINTIIFFFPKFLRKQNIILIVRKISNNIYYFSNT